VQLNLEHLEDRVTPSTTITVNNPSGGMDHPANVTVSTLGAKSGSKRFGYLAHGHLMAGVSESGGSGRNEVG
jgi:hypothetical protein